MLTHPVFMQDMTDTPVTVAPPPTLRQLLARMAWRAQAMAGLFFVSVFAFVGPFGTFDRFSFPQRLAYWLLAGGLPWVLMVCAVIGAIWVTSRVLPGARLQPVLAVGIAVTVWSVPAWAVVAATESAAGGLVSPALYFPVLYFPELYFPELYFKVLTTGALICPAACYALGVFTRSGVTRNVSTRGGVTGADRPARPAPVSSPGIQPDRAPDGWAADGRAADGPPTPDRLPDMPANVPADVPPDLPPDVPATMPEALARRLPPALQGGTLWSLSAEDHYVRLGTCKGRALVLMRFTDAVDSAGTVPGARIHRSHWVADAAIAGFARRHGRLFLELCDGQALPVSRRYRPAVRARGWLGPAGPV